MLLGAERRTKCRVNKTAQLSPGGRGDLHSPTLLPDHGEEQLLRADIALLESISDSPIVLGHVKTQTKVLKSGCPK